MRTNYLLASAMLTTMVACTGGNGASADLRQAKVPQTFGFATQKGLALSVQTPDAIFGDVDAAQLEVRAPGGDVVYRGSIRRGAAQQVSVLLPSAAATVEIHATGRAGEAHAQVGVTTGHRIEARLR